MQDLYRADGWGFLQRALGEKGWVEEMSGLAEVQRRADEVLGSGGVEWDSGDEEGDEGGLEEEGELL